jgi:hypothetical protein
MFSALHNSIASISYSRILWRLYVMGQSIQIQLAIGLLNPFLLPFASSLANDPASSSEPLQSEHMAARVFACCCVVLRRVSAVHTATALSCWQVMQTTARDFPVDFVRFPQSEHVSLPKYLDIIEHEADRESGQ